MSTTPAVDRFAVVLADRLSRIVPETFRVEADTGAGMLWYRHSGRGCSGSYIRDNYGRPGGTAEENITNLAVLVLDQLQDAVAEDTTDPWPRRGFGRQPPPHALIRDGHLHLWYGEGDEVTVACEPIPLPEIGP